MVRSPEGAAAGVYGIQSCGANGEPDGSGEGWQGRRLEEPKGSLGEEGEGDPSADEFCSDSPCS